MRSRFLVYACCSYTCSYACSLLVAFGVSGPAWGQNFGNISPYNSIGNPSPTAKAPAIPMTPNQAANVIGDNATVTAVGTTAIKASTVVWTPVSCGDATFNLPANPVDNEPHTIINSGVCPSNSLTISGNGHTIGGASAVVGTSPGSTQVRWSALSGSWVIAGIAGPVAVGGAIDITAFGCTPGSGADIVPCLNAAVAAYGSRPIHIPQGLYEVKSATTFNTVPNFVGDGWAEYNQNAACPTGNVIGTWFHESSAMAGTIPFTIMGPSASIGGNAGFKGIAFCQDQPAPGVGWAPTAYKQIFQLSNVGEVDFNDDYFYSVYDAFVINGSNASGRLHMSNVRGQVFHNFINADNVRDVIHVPGEVHLWTYWSSNANVVAWQNINAVPLQLGRVDGIVFGDFFSLGNFACLQSTPTTNGTLTYAAFASLYCDQSKFGINVADGGPGTMNVSAIQIGNAEFGGGNLPNSWGIAVSGTGPGITVQVGTVHFIAMGGGGVEIVSPSGTNNKVTIGSAVATNINQDNNGSALLTASPGNIISVANAPFFDGNNNGAPVVANVAAGGVYEVPVALPWTPGLAGSTTAGTPTYINQQGWYQQNGSTITAQFVLQLSNFTGSPAGNTTITGFPNIGSPVWTLPGGCTVSNQNIPTFDAGFSVLTGNIQTNDLVATIFEAGSTSVPRSQILPIANVGTSPTIEGLCTYQAKIF